MKILITGAGGYIASRLLATWSRDKKAHTVHGIDNRDIKGIIKTDITDTNALKNLISENKYDVVLHLASTFTKDTDKSFKINYRATVDFAEICYTHKVPKFVFLSTCGVYNPYDNSPYTTFKRKAEIQIGGWHFISVLRLGTVYGLAPIMNFEPLVNMLTKDAYEKKVIEVNGEGEYRPLLHVGDAVKALELVMTAPKGEYDAVTDNLTKGQIADAISKVIKGIEVVKNSGNSQGYKVEASANLIELGFKKESELITGIKEVVWYLKELEKYKNES